MTIVFRGSTFFLVFVITFKAGLFFVHPSSVDLTDIHEIDHFLDESARRRKEIEETGDTAAEFAASAAIVAHQAIFSAPVRRLFRGAIVTARSASSALLPVAGFFQSFFLESHNHTEGDTREKQAYYPRRPGPFLLLCGDLHWFTTRSWLPHTVHVGFCIHNCWNLLGCYGSLLARF